MPKKKHVWDQITISLKAHISSSELDTWFSHTTLKELTPKLAIIEVPNKFVASWLRDCYTVQLQKSFKETLNVKPEIRFAYEKPSFMSQTIESTPGKKAKDHDQSDLTPAWTFDNFIKAANNRFAFSSAQEVAEHPASQYNPLYLFSKQSLGKTHLLNAIGNSIYSTNPFARIRYIPLDKYLSEYLSAAKDHKLTDFREGYTSLDLILIDDIHLLTGREKAQEEMSSILNHFLDFKKQVVAAGNKPPSHIKGLLPPLRSRLQSGLIAEIQTPDQKTRRKTIKKWAKEANLNIPEDVTFFLSNATNDLKNLHQYLVSIETYASLYQRKIDMSTVKSLIKNTQLNKTSVQDIQRVTAGYFNISVSELLSNKKTRPYSYPRQMAMYLTRTLTKLSFKEIGKSFGNKDHSTVIYSVNRIDREKDMNKKIMNDINRLQSFFS